MQHNGSPRMAHVRHNSEDGVHAISHVQAWIVWMGG